MLVVVAALSAQVLPAKAVKAAAVMAQAVFQEVPTQSPVLQTLAAVVVGALALETVPIMEPQVVLVS